MDDLVADLLDAMAGRYDGLGPDQAARFRALAAAITRHAREENDLDLFNRWAGWLEANVNADDGKARDRLIYERILWYRAELDIDTFKALVDGWDVRGDGSWLLRRAGLLADLGRESEAAELSAQALNAGRAQPSMTDRRIA